MADSYSKWVMTTAFANNSQAALNSGGKIEWVSLKTSDDAHQVSDLDGFNDTTLATANIKQISGISSVTISGNTVTITGLFNSTNNASDYYIRTIFLVAKYNGKEFLAGTTVANTSGSAFRMPASSDTEITEFTARPQISVTNTNSISTTVDPVASATNERVDSLEATLQGGIDDINVDKQNLWNKLADYVTKAAAETITGVKTFSQTIVGSITGNAGTATKLQTERTIGFSGDVNGTAQGFDGSKNITLPINLNSINQNNTTSTQSAGYNSPVTIIDGINRDTKGRVTGVNTKTVTLPPVQTTISGNAASATKLETARLIGGVSFDGTSDIILPGVNSIGNQNTTGNAATATNADLATKAIALQTPRKINGTNFDGTTDINVPASNDANLVHKDSNETIGGNKNFSDKATFNKTIAGALETRSAPFSDFNEAATHLQDYQGKWNGGYDIIANSPEAGWFIVDVQTWGDGNNLGHLILRYTDHNAVWVGLAISGKISWKKLASDDTVMHLSGDETASGFKKFSGNIATTSDNSMINGGGNNGDLAMVKKSGSPAYLAVGNVNPRFIVRQSNNAAVSPSDTFQDMFTVNVDGTVRAGLQQDLVPLDKNVVHNSGSEVIGGDKTFTGNDRFTNPVYGSLATNPDWFTSFDDVAKNMKKYAGYTSSGTGYITDMPYPGYGVIHVQPFADGANMNNTGLITINYTNTPITVIGHVNGGVISWEFTANDATVVHNTGDETVNGVKTFTSAINGSLNGNAASATKLATPRNINGVGFDGSNNISVNAANDSNLVHKNNDETLTGNKNFSGVTTFAKAQTSSTITKTITTSLPTILQFTETAFGVMVYASGYGHFSTDGQWKTLATLPSGITPPTQTVIMSDVDWAGVGGVTLRLGINLKISIKPTGEIMYKVASLKENDNNTYDVQTSFDLSTYWSK